ncbi:MAG: deoxyribonuclease IV [Erysipelotrichaceae bacterium]|nr:deoxyribonuclease IV [Erysipelotrichaceae bacterium]
MKIGSHVSMKAPDYLLGSVQEMVFYGANCMMIYTGPPQNTRRQPVDKMKVIEAKKQLQELGIGMDHIIVHAPYIINLGNVENEATFQLGVDFLKQEIERTKAIGASVIVLHPGSYVRATQPEGIQRIIDGLNQVFKTHQGVYIALETMAGKGSEIGRNFEEIQKIIQGVKHNEWLKVCMDTCHLHDSGRDLADFDSILAEFDSMIGLERLACIHINDSKNVQGAMKDRHENIGYGEIGFEVLNTIVHHPLLKNTVKILETPYIGENPPYKMEIENFVNQQFVPFKSNE